MWHEPCCFCSFHLGFPGGLAANGGFPGSNCNAGDLGSIPGLGRFPGEGKGYPLQYSGLEKYSPWGHTGPDMTELLSLHFASVNPTVTLQKRSVITLGAFVYCCLKFFFFLPLLIFQISTPFQNSVQLPFLPWHLSTPQASFISLNSMVLTSSFC